MLKLIIDRFEGNYAICETAEKTKINISKSILPEEIKEGDCIVKEDDGTISFKYNETLERKKYIQKKFNNLI